MKENIAEISVENGEKAIFIRRVLFRGRRNIAWHEVENYLKSFVGKSYLIPEYGDRIFIGTDFPDEYTGATYTKKLKGTLAKAKANAAQAVPELLQIATNKRFKENLKEKHCQDAGNGWYRYDTKFALPVYGENQELERLNIFYAMLLVRHSYNGKRYRQYKKRNKQAA